MKKQLCIGLALILCLSCFNAFAMNHTPYSENDSTFETFAEACENGPKWLSDTFGGNYIVNPCLAEYPGETTYIYRSANRWAPTSAGYRKNTTLLVYTDAALESKDAALAYLNDMGLVEIIEECKGSIVLVTPINQTAFNKADQYAYYLMQTAMMNLGGTATVNEERFTCAEGAYYGGTTYRYVIGVDGGATFLNNFISSSFDYVTRIAGMLLVGGSMDRIRDVAGIVPVYMVNPVDLAVEKYKSANETDSRGYNGDVDFYFNKALPLQKVMVAKADKVDLKETVQKAYYDMFIHSQRIPVVVSDLHSASAPFTNVNWNQAPYSLADRNAFYNNETADGLVIEEFREDRFSDYVVPDNPQWEGHFALRTGEYIDVWYEVMPKEVISGEASEHSVPLWLALHGGGDDAIQFLDEMGMLELAGKERFAMIAPMHVPSFTIGSEVLPKVVEYILNKYPALDPSRVYVTGYSMGGGATLHAINGNAGMFAAAVPQAAAIFNKGDDEIVKLDDYDMPILFTTATNDFCGFNTTVREPEQIHQVYMDRINDYLTLNGMEKVEYDFNAYPISGFKADSYVEQTLNNEYRNYNWLFNNDQGIPMVGLNVTDYLPHGLYQEFGRIAWEFAKHYSRDLETGEVIYNPY